MRELASANSATGAQLARHSRAQAPSLPFSSSQLARLSPKSPRRNLDAKFSSPSLKVVAVPGPGLALSARLELARLLFSLELTSSNLTCSAIESVALVAKFSFSSSPRELANSTNSLATWPWWPESLFLPLPCALSRLCVVMREQSRLWYNKFGMRANLGAGRCAVRQTVQKAPQCTDCTRRRRLRIWGRSARTPPRARLARGPRLKTSLRMRWAALPCHRCSRRMAAPMRPLDDDQARLG